MFTDPRLTNFLANMLALLAVSAMAVGVVLWVARRPYFTLTRIEIAPMQSEALHYVSPSTVRATIAGASLGNFFSADLDRVRALFETVPWVRQARVRRVWPNELEVRLEEHQPLALWNEDQMINTWGEAFRANQGELPDDETLPHFYGPDNSERLVVQRYAELARWFAPLGLRVGEVSLSPRYAWSVEMAEGLRLNLGRDPAADAADPHGRSGALSFATRIQRFVQAWPVLAQRLDGRAVLAADLRYANGFAVTLAPVSTPTRR
jgi:cell division protein FtsQ